MADSGIVLFCDGLILIQHALVSLPSPWSRTIISLETEITNASVGDPTYIDGSQLSGPVSALNSTECSLAGDLDGVNGGCNIGAYCLKRDLFVDKVTNRMQCVLDRIKNISRSEGLSTLGTLQDAVILHVAAWRQQS